MTVGENGGKMGSAGGNLRSRHVTAGAGTTKKRGTRRVFVGVHERQLDERGRVALPSSYRSDLGDHCYLFFGDDGCVSIRSTESFDQQAAELVDAVKRGDTTRNRMRAFAASASQATIDKQGRITLDARLREHAGIEPHAPVVVLGLIDQIEIWEPESYRANESAGQHEIARGGR